MMGKWAIYVCRGFDPFFFYICGIKHDLFGSLFINSNRSPRIVLGPKFSVAEGRSYYLLAGENDRDVG